jgi:uncharacterized protein YjdB
MGIYSDNTTVPLTDQVTWTSDDATVASVDNASGHRGEVRALKVGSTSLHAQLGAVSASVPVTVTQAQLVSIEVSPAAATVAAGFHLPFVALGTLSDHSTQDLTGQVTWRSSSLTVASVSNGVTTHGLATGHAPGNATITAALAGISGSAVLTVTPALLVSLSIEPLSSSMFRGSSAPRRPRHLLRRRLST